MLLGAGGPAAAAEEAVVSGQAIYRERIAMPPGAVFEAILEDVSLADTASVALGRAVVEDAGQPPYAFEIAYDPTTIDPAHRYAVRARLSVGGELKFTSDTVHPVLTGGAPGRVEVTMVRVPADRAADGGLRPRSRQAQTAPAVEAAADAGSAETAPTLKGFVTFMADVAQFTDCRSGATYPVAEEGEFEALVHAYLAAGREPGAAVMVSFEGDIEDRPGADGTAEVPSVVVGRFVGVWPDQSCDQALGDATLKNTVWVIERLGPTGIAARPDHQEPTLLLDGEGRFSATLGCNQFAGGFEQEDARLTFGRAAATLMACQPPLDDWERQLGEVLAETASWRITGDALELLGADGAPIAGLKAKYLY